MDAKTLRALGKCDPVMAALIAAAPKFKPRPVSVSPFEALAESIAYQQLAGKAAATIWGRVLALYRGRKLPSPKRVLETPMSDLRSAGLSNNKALAILDLALKATQGLVPTLDQAFELTDEELIERLTQVRGIGPWTVHMFLIFHLRRPDVLPTEDYGVRSGFKSAYAKDALPTPKDLYAFAEVWRPFRTTASWYLWRALDLHRAIDIRTSRDD